MNDKIKDAARAAHEINRVYCREVMGDNSHLAWKDVPADQWESIYEGVRAIANDPAMTPAQLHQHWVDYKLGQGWTYGPMRDHSRKTHPCLVAYRDLPLVERIKDVIFGVVVRTVLGIEHEVSISSLLASDIKTDPGRKGQLGQ